MESKLGVCVITGTGNACWDVCDLSKQPQDYVVTLQSGAVNDNNTAMKLLVTEIRNGKNLNVECKVKAPTTEWCSPGDLCGGFKETDAYGTANSAHAQSIPQDRGMCVVDANGPGGRMCVDMCNYNMPLDKYRMGTPEGTVATVQGVRSSGACGGTPWWPIVLGLLLLLCCLAGITALVLRFGKPNMKRFRGANIPRVDPGLISNHEAREQALEEPVLDRMEEPPQMSAPPPAAPAYDTNTQCAQCGSTYLEDEKVCRRCGVPRPGFVPERPERAEEQVQPPTQNTGGTLFQGTIPGLDEPHLTYPGVQPYLAPQTQAQVADPSLVAQAQPIAQMPQQGYFGMAPSQPPVPAQADAYRTTFLAPTGLSQPPIVSQRGSMQVQPGPYSTQPLWR